MGIWWCLVCSLILNLLLVSDRIIMYKNRIDHSVGTGELTRLSWSRRAAEEAEAVATVTCSGHGRAYLDGFLLHPTTTPHCECNSCFLGSDCSQISSDCSADVDSGDPLFLEPFWMKNAASSAMLVAGWHRMSYTFEDHSSLSSQALENQIRELHDAVGNAVTEGRLIVFGAGSAHLLNAAVHALSQQQHPAGMNSSAPAKVVASIPFYPVFRSGEFEFGGDTSMWKEKSSRSGLNFIQIVTSPNNPDCEMKKAVLENVKAIHDQAYYWPRFTAIPASADEDVMLFSLSKLTGHAGTRLGWAVVKDEGVYARMLNYVRVNTLGISRDTQLELLKAVKEGGSGREIFEFGHATMKQRWHKLTTLLSLSKRFSLQHIPPQFCTFFPTLRPPPGGKGDRLSWSRRAAQEAEAVAAVGCSGHGRAYLDGLLVDGTHVCECNSCYGGPHCSHFFPDCVADADGGDPLFLEPFWMQNAASSAMVVAGWHRMSYSFPNKSPISQLLEDQIRKLHATVGNAVTQGRFMLFGAGSTQLLNAAVHALSPDHDNDSSSSASPAKVVASLPFYPVYQLQTEFFRSVDFAFDGDAALWKNKSGDSSLNFFIEFVNSPNNPDGQLKKAVLEGGPNVKTIHDFAYFWPHFTPIPAPADEDLMIFTLSKLTGHAGTRFGWALVKDFAVYQKMLSYVEMNTLTMSKDLQLRALQLLKAAMEGRSGRELFHFGYKTMNQRWESLRNALSPSNRFSLPEIPPRYCIFSKTLKNPSPAYAWLKCEREEDKECYAVLKDAGIIGREGRLFGAESSYVRLSLLRSQDDFDALLNKINKLVTVEEKEDGGSKSA